MIQLETIKIQYTKTDKKNLIFNLAEKLSTNEINHEKKEDFIMLEFIFVVLILAARIATVLFALVCLKITPIFLTAVKINIVFYH